MENLSPRYYMAKHLSQNPIYGEDYLSVPAANQGRRVSLCVSSLSLPNPRHSARAHTHTSTHTQIRAYL